jgi:hypothetical protein
MAPRGNSFGRTYFNLEGCDFLSFLLSQYPMGFGVFIEKGASDCSGYSDAVELVSPAIIGFHLLQQQRFGRTLDPSPWAKPSLGSETSLA